MHPDSSFRSKRTTVTVTSSVAKTITIVDTPITSANGHSPKLRKGGYQLDKTYGRTIFQ